VRGQFELERLRKRDTPAEDGETLGRGMRKNERIATVDVCLKRRERDPGATAGLARRGRGENGGCRGKGVPWP